MAEENRLLDVLSNRERELLDDWINDLISSRFYRETLMHEADLRSQCAEFLSMLRQTLHQGGAQDFEGAAWEPIRQRLAESAHALARLGYTPAEAAGFVLLLKRPLFTLLAEETQEGGRLANALWSAGRLLDRLALWQADVLHQQQQETISRQRSEMLELSTPVIALWDGILALPLIGTLDSARAQVVIESLLEKIVTAGADVAILDITGVPTVDTMVAQHLLKAVTAAHLMGAECIISGIRPTIAQTMVQLGVDLRDVTTRGTLADALSLALERRGMRIQPLKREG